MAWRIRHKPRTQPAGLLQVLAWQQRLDSLKQSLDTQPQGEWAWLWRTRIKVLSYLLDQHETAESRKIGSEMLGEQKQESPSRTITKTSESTAPYDRRPINTSGFETALPLDYEKQQQRLKSLLRVNEERRASEPPIETPAAPIYPAYKSTYVEPYAPDDNWELPDSPFMTVLKRVGDALPDWLVRLMLTEIPLPNLLTDRREPKAPPKPYLAPLTRHREPPHSTDQELEALAEVLAQMEADSMEAWRHIIAFDLGVPDLTDDVLSKEEIRAILIEHGIAEPEDE